MLLFFYSKEEAVAMEMELLRDYHYGLHQLTEILGHACAVAITKVWVLTTSLHSNTPYIAGNLMLIVFR